MDTRLTIIALKSNLDLNAMNDNSNTSNAIKHKLKQHINKEKVFIYRRFFKTGKGEYGEGDKFIGVTVPNIRIVAKENKCIKLSEIQILLSSEIHEHRLCGLLILTYKYPTANESEKLDIVNFYLRNLNNINNWDLVDLSAYKIIGMYLLDHDNLINEIKSMASSKHLWTRRVAMISMFVLIKNDKFEEPFKIIEILINDSHDLMHKAVGWMLREIGKRNELELTKFLDHHAITMPRTTLRYSIERLNEKQRRYYMQLKNK